MHTQKLTIDGIPAIIWGERSDRVYLVVHGKSSCKEDAERFATIAVDKGYQVISFDLPEHGERASLERACTVQNGVQDLRTVMDYVRQNWNSVSLFATSLGAYFSLVAYRDVDFDKCLFSSPILNMQRLIENMMRWFNVTPEQLQVQCEIPTPIGETLSWDYYRYVREYPVEVWNSPTAILYPELDNLTEPEVVDEFAERFGARVQRVAGSEHYMHSDAELAIMDAWMIQHA
jgi:alpha-beta hydrolase superfamily lysophospholipase